MHRRVYCRPPVELPRAIGELPTDVFWQPISRPPIPPHFFPPPPPPPSKGPLAAPQSARARTRSQALFAKIKAGEFEFHDDRWAAISPDAIDLIRRMLTVDQTERWTAAQLLEHKFFTASDSELTAHDMSRTLGELKRYQAQRRFKAAANAVFTATRLSSSLRSSPLSSPKRSPLSSPKAAAFKTASGEGH